MESVIFLDLIPCGADDCDGFGDSRCLFCKKGLCSSQHWNLCSECGQAYCSDCLAPVSRVCCLCSTGQRVKNSFEDFKRLYEGKIARADHFQFIRNACLIHEEEEANKGSEWNIVRTDCLKKSILYYIEKDCSCLADFEDGESYDNSIQEEIAKLFPSMQWIAANERRERNFCFFMNDAYYAHDYEKTQMFSFVLIHQSRSDQKLAISLLKKFYEKRDEEHLIRMILKHTVLTQAMWNSKGENMLYTLEEMGYLCEAPSKDNLLHMCNNERAIDIAVDVFKLDINGLDTSQRHTALAYACQFGHETNLVRKLIRKGASVENLIEKRVHIRYDHLLVILEEFGEKLIHRFYPEMLLPGYSKSSQLDQLLRKLDYNLDDFVAKEVEEFKKAFETENMQAHEFQRRRSLLADLYIVGRVKLEQFSEDQRKILEEFLDGITDVVNERCFRFMNDAAKKKAKTFLLCLKRMELEIGKTFGKDITSKLIIMINEKKS